MRLIDADSVLATLKDKYDNAWNDIRMYVDDVKNIINNAPTIDAERVIRCINCKRVDICQISPYYGKKEEEFFCAEGEEINEAD